MLHRICILISFIILNNNFIAAQETALLKEVEDIINPPDFKTKWLEKNIYPHFITLAYRKNDNQAIATRVIKNNYEQFQALIQKEKEVSEREEIETISQYSSDILNFNVHYQADWRRYIGRLDGSTDTSHDLFKQIKNSKKSIYKSTPDGILDNYQINKELIDNYQLLMNSGDYYCSIPYYPTYITLVTKTEQDPNIDEYNELSNLRLARALLFILEKEVTTGLDMIEYELDLARKLNLSNCDIDFSMTVVSLYQLEAIYLIANDLLNTNIINEHRNHPLFQKIQVPLFESEDIFQAFLASGMKHKFKKILQLHSIQLNNKTPIIKGVRYPWGVYSYEKIDVNQTLNLLYEYYSMGLRNLDNGLPLSSPSISYINALNQWKKNHQLFEIDDIQNFIFRIRIEDTLGRTIDVADLHQYDKIINFYKSVMNLQKTVSIKYEIIKQNMNHTDASAYLQQLDENLFDEIETKPFSIDYDNGLIIFSYYPIFFTQQTTDPQIKIRKKIKVFKNK